ncbi:MAG: hypothetical protein AAF628_27645 [Planctomycetota bacterium]
MTGEPDTPRPRRGRRLLRRIATSLVAALLVYAGAWWAGWIKLATARGIIISLAPAVHEPELRHDDGKRRVAVLLHGMAGSSWSMWRLERTLAAHGYEVVNETYDEYDRRLADVADGLHERIEARLGEDSDVALYGVAHSMGGLVLRAYLSRPDARAFDAVVCLGTPHRGAILADLLGSTWYYRLLFGDKAAIELAPSSGVADSLAVPGNVGNVIGARGDDGGYSSSIPGDDDGRVAVHEAHLDGERDSLVVSMHHGFLMVDADVLRQVLHFFRHGRFDHAEPGR